MKAKATASNFLEGKERTLMQTEGCSNVPDAHSPPSRDSFHTSKENSASKSKYKIFMNRTAENTDPGQIPSAVWMGKKDSTVCSQGCRMDCKVTSWSPPLLVESSPPHSQTCKYTMCNSHYIAAVSAKQEGTLMDRTWIIFCLTSTLKSHLLYKLIFPKGNQMTLIVSMAAAWNREPPTSSMGHHGGGDGDNMTDSVWWL